MLVLDARLAAWRHRPATPNRAYSAMMRTMAAQKPTTTYSQLAITAAIGRTNVRPQTTARAMCSFALDRFSYMGTFSGAEHFTACAVAKQSILRESPIRAVKTCAAFVRSLSRLATHG